MPDVTLHGGEDVDALMRRLRTHADAKAIKRELYAGLNRATKSVRADMKASIPASLPSRNGLASLVHSKASITATASYGKHAGVRIRARSRAGGGSMKSLNAGRLRHPVFGRSDQTRKEWTWVTQTEGVNGGFLDESFDKQKPELVRAIGRVLDDIARKVEGF